MGTEGGLGGGPPSSPSSSLKLRSWATDSNLPGSDVDDAASLWSNGALNNKMLLRHFFFVISDCAFFVIEREREDELPPVNNERWVSNRLRHYIVSKSFFFFVMICNCPERGDFQPELVQCLWDTKVNSCLIPFKSSLFFVREFVFIFFSAATSLKEAKNNNNTLVADLRVIVFGLFLLFCFFFSGQGCGKLLDTYTETAHLRRHMRAEEIVFVCF